MEREFWLKHAQLLPRPVITASRILPSSLVDHLISQKSRHAVKQKHGHRITPLQGACHSLVVPVVFPVYMNGITSYRNRKHVIDPLPSGEPPYVVISALVQPDFEFKTVMWEMIRLENLQIEGKPLFPDSKGYSEKDLKKNFVYHFTKTHTLPAVQDLKKNDEYPIKEEITISLEGDVLSLEMLRNIVREQIRVEMIALTSIALNFGIKLVYTWDPPSIFAKAIGLEILDRMWFEAITHPGILSNEIACIAFNDFSNKTMIAALRDSLSESISVCRKCDVKVSRGQFKVLHTNGDAFGEHIISQPGHSSLEGAIGTASSAAASLCLRAPYPTRWA